MTKDYIYFFLHISKTGGTTLIKHVTSSLKSDEYLELSYSSLGLNENVIDYNLILESTQRLLSKLSQKRKDGIKFVYGHLMPYGIHRYFKQKARYITIVRDPIDRIISNYNYLRKLYENKDKKNPGTIFTKYLLINHKVPQFKQWYVAKFDKEGNGIGNLPMYKVLNYNGFFSKNDIKGMIKKFYFLSYTENLANDIYIMFSFFNIRKFFLNQNLSNSYVSRNNLLSIHKRLNTSLDYSIYNRIKIANKKYIATKKNYQAIIQSQKLRRLLLLPFTQILFDPRGIKAFVHAKYNKTFQS